MNTLTDIDMSVLSDMHKDALGYRPNAEFWARVKNMSDEEVRELMDGLQEDVESEILQDAARELASQRIFERSIQTWIDVGAGNRETAFRWMAQADDLNLSVDQDAEHMLWRAGLAQEFWPQYMTELGFVRKGMVWIKNSEMETV